MSACSALCRPLMPVLAAFAFLAGCRRHGAEPRLWLHMPLDGSAACAADGDTFEVEVAGLAPAPGRNSRPNGAVAFGRDARIEVQDIPLAGRDFSIAAWIRVPTNRPAGQIVLGQGRPAPHEGLHLAFNPDRPFVFGYYANDLDLPEGTAFDDGQWHHWVVTRKKRAWYIERCIYLDGVLVVSGETRDPYRGSGPLVIGQAPWGGADFTGALDELQVYQGALTPAHVERLYAAPPGPEA